MKKTNKYFMCSRQSRETLMEYWLSHKIIVPSLVLKEFYHEEDAKEYLENLNQVDDIINKLL